MDLEKLEQKMDKVVESIHRVEKDIARNTMDMAHHIKRTDLIEGKLQRIIYLLLVGAGIGLALYGPQFLKLIGWII